jgi:hypothetical protein
MNTARHLLLVLLLVLLSVISFVISFGQNCSVGKQNADFFKHLQNLYQISTKHFKTLRCCYSFFADIDRTAARLSRTSTKHRPNILRCYETFLLSRQNLDRISTGHLPNIDQTSAVKSPLIVNFFYNKQEKKFTN